LIRQGTHDLPVHLDTAAFSVLKKKYLIMVCLTMRSVAKIMWRRMIALLVNSELEGIWKGAVMTYLKASSRHLPGGTEESNGNRDSRL
jgi:hypothetical protein